LADGVRRELLGLAMGMRYVGNRFADFVAPMVFGVAISWGGYPLAFYAASLLMVLGVIIVPLHGTRHFQRPSRITVQPIQRGEP
jgi:dipeptide/tripeptide permease